MDQELAICNFVLGNNVMLPMNSVKLLGRRRHACVKLLIDVRFIIKPMNHMSIVALILTSMWLQLRYLTFH